MSDEPARLTATQMRAALAGGGLSVERLAQACLDRIAARQPAVGAFAHFDPPMVLAQARALDAAHVRGPLHGLPIAVKDVITTVDMPTRYNSPLHDDATPSVDAACVALLRRAGALILGKTATVEFGAVGRSAATRNPHDLARTPGGSSSGSAAAVADFQAPLALGTQTGGSIIRPASFCGVWAFKPSFGRISNEGCKRFASSLDTLGWFARSPEDLALLFEAFDGAPPPSRPPPSPSSLRIALCRTPMWERAEAATLDAFASTAAAFSARGVAVEPLEADALLADLPAMQRLIMRAEGRVSFQPERSRLHGAMADLANGVDVAADAELFAAQDAAAVARVAFDRLAAPFDAVLTPSVVGEAPEGLAATGDLIFNGLWTLLHVPAVNLPAGRGPHGLPIGLTLVAPRGADRRLLDVARTLGG